MAFSTFPVKDFNTGVGVDLVPFMGLVKPSETGAVEIGTEEHPFVTKISTEQTVPVSGPITNAQLIAAIAAINSWVTPKEQITVIKTITATAVIEPCKSFVIARTDTNSDATVQIQGKDSTEPPFSLGIKQGISSTVISPRDTLTGLEITVEGTGSVSINAIILIDKPAT